PDKAFLIHLLRSFCQRPRPGSLHVESRQAKTAADDVHERQKPRQLTRVGPILQSRSVAPGINQHCGSQPERNNIGQRIELNPNLSSALGHSRDPPVKHVAKERPADGYRGIVKPELRVLYLGPPDSQQTEAA